jgi:hypothetical protein
VTAASTREAGIGYKPDGRWKDMWVEVKARTHGLGNLRASLLGFAYWLRKEPNTRGLLLLLNSRITYERVQKELRLAKDVLDSNVMKRLTVAVAKNSHYVGLPQDLGHDFREWLSHLVIQEPRRTGSRGSFYTILEILLHEWLLGHGPMTTGWLMKTAGYSYPTVAKALERLSNSIDRHSDRRIELNHFPRQEWARLVAESDRIRGTAYFVDRSGRPRSPESLFRRIQRLDRRDLAVGGVWGAKHYHPDLDLMGNPRLDLSLHSPSNKVDWSFVDRLDPALKRTERRDEAAALAVHLVRRASPLFQADRIGPQWADPVECLLDLHEAHLEPQAREFLNSFPPARGKL